jgi:hypothetical protein
MGGSLSKLGNDRRVNMCRVEEWRASCGTAGSLMPAERVPPGFQFD